MRVLIKLFFPFLLIANMLQMPMGFQCGYNPHVAALLDETIQVRWVNWIAALSGKTKVTTADGDGYIRTRSSFVLFEPGHIPSAFQYVQEELEDMGFFAGKDFEVHTYNFPFEERHPDRNWKNLILTFPGKNPALAKERVLLVAHLDSTSEKEHTLAPGADDNASGAAGLLEAAAVLRHYKFERTLHLIWFSGEEQSRRGSEHFAVDYQHWLPDIIGVVNLDMFAFDWDNDRCFEVHAGTLPGSHIIGECIQTVINSYELDLTFDFIDDETAYTFSDHYAFWLEDVPGVMVFENGFYQEGKTCGKADSNYAYHTVRDTLVYINQDTGFSILQAALAATAHMAGPMGACFSEPIRLDSRELQGCILLSWERLPDVQKYQVWTMRDNRWHLAGETVAPRWLVLNDECNTTTLIYRVVAITQEGCQSLPGLFPLQ